MPRPTGHLRSQDSYLHIPQIYCNTLLSTNSTARILREEPAITGLTRTPTEQNVTTMDGLVIAMCFPMVCCDGERREDYDTQYSERRRTAPASAARTADALRVHLHHVQLLMSLFPPESLFFGYSTLQNKGMCSAAPPAESPGCQHSE